MATLTAATPQTARSAVVALLHAFRPRAASERSGWGHDSANPGGRSLSLASSRPRRVPITVFVSLVRASSLSSSWKVAAARQQPAAPSDAKTAGAATLEAKRRRAEEEEEVVAASSPPPSSPGGKGGRREAAERAREAAAADAEAAAAVVAAEREEEEEELEVVAGLLLFEEKRRRVRAERAVVAAAAAVVTDWPRSMARSAAEERAAEVAAVVAKEEVGVEEEGQRRRRDFDAAIAPSLPPAPAALAAAARTARRIAACLITGTRLRSLQMEVRRSSLAALSPPRRRAKRERERVEKKCFARRHQLEVETFSTTTNALTFRTEEKKKTDITPPLPRCSPASRSPLFLSQLSSDQVRGLVEKGPHSESQRAKESLRREERRKNRVCPDAQRKGNEKTKPSSRSPPSSRARHARLCSRGDVSCRQNSAGRLLGGVEREHEGVVSNEKRERWKKRLPNAKSASSPYDLLFAPFRCPSSCLFSLLFSSFEKCPRPCPRRRRRCRRRCFENEESERNTTVRSNFDNTEREKPRKLNLFWPFKNTHTRTHTHAHAHTHTATNKKKWPRPLYSRRPWAAARSPSRPRTPPGLRSGRCSLEEEVEAEVEAEGTRTAAATTLARPPRLLCRRCSWARRPTSSGAARGLSRRRAIFLPLAARRSAPPTGSATARW